MEGTILHPDLLLPLGFFLVGVKMGANVFLDAKVQILPLPILHPHVRHVWGEPLYDGQDGIGMLIFFLLGDGGEGEGRECFLGGKWGGVG